MSQYISNIIEVFILPYNCQAKVQSKVRVLDCIFGIQDFTTKKPKHNTNEWILFKWFL